MSSLHVSDVSGCYSLPSSQGYYNTRIWQRIYSFNPVLQVVSNVSSWSPLIDLTEGVEEDTISTEAVRREEWVLVRNRTLSSEWIVAHFFHTMVQRTNPPTSQGLSPPWINGKNLGEEGSPLSLCRKGNSYIPH